MDFIKRLKQWHKEEKYPDAAYMTGILQDLPHFLTNLIESGSENEFQKTAYIDLRETNGKNRSKDLDQLILRNGGRLGDPYCVFGIQDILRNMEKRYEIRIDLPKTGGVRKLWDQTKAEYKSQLPDVYSIGCYQLQGSQSGHAVWVLGIATNGRLSTFEFNTSPNRDEEIVRDGSACFYKQRNIEGFGNMKLLGFIDVVKAMKR